MVIIASAKAALSHHKRRAGVGKAAIYRRWSSKAALITDVLVNWRPDLRTDDAPDTGTLAGDIDELRSRHRVIRGPERVGQAFPITHDRLIVGRGAGCQLDLSGRRVSRPHCAILWDAEAGFFEVVDLGSKNKTFVNDRKVPGRALLAAGDHLGVGEFELVFEPRLAGSE